MADLGGYAHSKNYAFWQKDKGFAPQEPGKWSWLGDWMMDPKKGGLVQFESIMGGLTSGMASAQAFDTAALGFGTQGILAGVNQGWAETDIALLPLREIGIDLNYFYARREMATAAIAATGTVRAKTAGRGFVVDVGHEDSSMLLRGKIFEKLEDEQSRARIDNIIMKFNYLELPKYAAESRAINAELAGDIAKINQELAVKQANLATSSAKIQGVLNTVKAGASAYLSYGLPSLSEPSPTKTDTKTDTEAK